MIIDTERGTHDDLVLSAVNDLPRAEWLRWSRELAQFLYQFRRALTALSAGVSVAPYYRRPVAEVLADEACRRAELGDPTCFAWARVADTQAVREEFKLIMSPR